MEPRRPRISQRPPGKRLSEDALREFIEQTIRDEDESPLQSDDRIAEALQKRGFTVFQRRVT